MSTAHAQGHPIFSQAPLHNYPSMGDAVARALSKQQKTLKRMGFDPARPGDGVIRNKLGMPVMEKGMRVAFPGIRLLNPILNIVAFARGERSEGPLDLRQMRSGSKMLWRYMALRRSLNRATEEKELKQRYLAFMRHVEKAQAVSNPAISGGRYMRLWSSWMISNSCDVSRKLFRAGRLGKEELGHFSGTRLLELLLAEKSKGHAKKLLKAMAKGHKVVYKKMKGERNYFKKKDLVGLTEDAMRYFRVWYRTDSYCLRADRATYYRVVGECHNRKTREIIFNAYHRHFYENEAYDKSILAVLQSRKRVAESLGFASWGEMENAQLGIHNDAHLMRVLQHCWNDSLPLLVPFVKRLEQLKLGAMAGRVTPESKGPLTTNVDIIDELFYVTMCRQDRLQRQLAEYMVFGPALKRYSELASRLFNVNLIDESDNVSFGHEGWDRDVKIMHVVNAGTNAHIGYWYVRVFARSKKYKTGLANTVLLCDGHVFTELNFVRPQVNVVRKLYYEEVLSFGHQMGTAMHMLFGQSKTAHLPLDAKALAGSLAELAALDSDVIRYMARDGGRVPSEHEIRSVRRDVYFYVWALREIAVICVLHSGEFDPDTATVEDLRNKATEVARAFSPVELAPSYHPLSAEAGMWTVSEGATEKLGYLFAHMRASSLLSRLRASAKGRTNSVYNTPPVTEGMVGELLRNELLEKKFSPHSLECLMAAIDGASRPVHPLPPITVQPPTAAPKLNESNFLQGAFSGSIYSTLEMRGTKRVDTT